MSAVLPTPPLRLALLLVAASACAPLVPNYRVAPATIADPPRPMPRRVGVVVVEVVFVYPGMGQFLVDHVSKRDVPVVQACGLIFAAVYIGLNLVADLVSILANPRLRHPK